MISDYAYHDWKEGDFYFLGKNGVRLIELVDPNTWKVRVYDDKYENITYKTVHVIELRTKPNFEVPEKVKL